VPRFVPNSGTLQRIPAHEVDDMGRTIGDMSYSKVNASTYGGNALAPARITDADAKDALLRSGYLTE
jgi:hypothetical protein